MGVGRLTTEAQCSLPLLREGKGLDEVCRQLEIAESTWHRWRNQCGGMRLGVGRLPARRLLAVPFAES